MSKTENRRRAPRAPRTVAAAAAILAATPGAGASFQWTITFDSPPGILSTYQPQVLTVAHAAASEWSRHFTDGAGTIDILIRVEPTLATASGRSLTSSFLYHNGDIDVWEQGAAAEIRRGIDPNGLTADVEITLGQSFLQSSTWWDPNPTDPSSVPLNLFDGYSVLLHEIGHALGFNGWRNPYSGALGAYGSNFDELTTTDGDNFFFTGHNAAAVYQGHVPLTWGNIFHLGNRPARPGSDLVADLMNGVAFERGRRYEISRLDLAILADLGLPVRIPDVPAPATLALAALAPALGAARRRRA